MEEVTCKVCSARFDLSKTSYCPECGFEMHMYPEPNYPESVKYEEERVAVHMEFYNKWKQNEKALESARTKSEEDKQRIAQLEKDLADAQLKASKTKGEKPKAFLLIKDGQRESVGAVYDGRNTYGCFLGGITDVNHQELHIEGLKPLHFSIEVVDDHYRFFDLIGDVKSGKNSISDRGVSLHNGGRLEIGSNITITFIITM